METRESSDRPIRLAYVSQYAEDDRTSWSGIPFQYRKALEDIETVEVIPIMGLKPPMVARLIALGKKVIYRFVVRREYRRDRSPSILRSFARQAEAKLNGLKVDAIISPGTLPIAYLETTKPLAFFSDASFLGLCDYYSDFSKLCRETRIAGKDQDDHVLNECTLAIYSSDWAGKSAVEHHHLDPAKLAIIPFGANETSGQSPDEIRKSIQARRAQDSFRILFNGVDWERKGGPLAIEAVRILRSKGLDARLDIVGCTPAIEDEPWVAAHGFISRQETEGREKLNRIFNRTHFLLLPSRAECFGIVFAEAASFGIPSISTLTGGIPNAIAEGENGHLLPLAAGPGAYAEIIAEYIADPDKYTKLAFSSFERFSHSLSWKAAARKTLLELQKRIQESPPSRNLPMKRKMAASLGE